MPSVERPDPPYMQVARQLRERILSGEMAEGSVVPPVRTIAAEWTIAHATAAKVLTTLRSEGLVTTKPGVGTVVTSRQQHRSAQDRLVNVQRTGTIYPEGHYARIRSAELIQAPPHVAEALALDLHAPVIRRQRTTYNQADHPEATSVSWFDGALAESCPKLLTTERIKGGTAHYITQHTQLPLQRGREGVAAVAAPAEVARELQIMLGAPVLAGRNWWRDTNGRVAEFGESFTFEGRWIYFEYEIKGSE